jgi:prepilin-type N-terminal cleavage/methylation domain-containing protein
MKNVMKTNRKIVQALDDRSGFTLVEVLVASMILVVALLTLASMFPVWISADHRRRAHDWPSGACHILEDVGDIPSTTSSTSTRPTRRAIGRDRRIGRHRSGARKALALHAGRLRQRLHLHVRRDHTAWGTVQPFAGRAG